MDEHFLVSQDQKWYPSEMWSLPIHVYTWMCKSPHEVLRHEGILGTGDSANDLHISAVAQKHFLGSYSSCIQPLSDSKVCLPISFANGGRGTRLCRPAKTPIAPPCDSLFDSLFDANRHRDHQCMHDRITNCM